MRSRRYNSGEDSRPCFFILLGGNNVRYQPPVTMDEYERKGLTLFLSISVQFFFSSDKHSRKGERSESFIERSTLLIVRALTFGEIAMFILFINGLSHPRSHSEFRFLEIPSVAVFPLQRLHFEQIFSFFIFQLSKKIDFPSVD
ncbi:hypothetical protein Nepgr_026919 [Nepenthes gracilis]|uniref:Uncharacterized protein n=1 Tax=Nepenthes gracilis TaxID=150966 RepID=A0AAD3T9G6_NEPGR|nr:hypothetical protein Nepgr_026919 [Nepenthes gracilis]